MKKQSTFHWLGKKGIIGLICLCAFLFTQAGTLNAQSERINVSGTVTAPDGSPLSGASIIESGTANAAISNNAGNFTIRVAPQSSLDISYLGYESVTIPVNGKTRIDVRLDSESQVMDEVVVVGYGTMRRKDLTGSVVQIRPDNLATENPNSVQDILRGTPGLHVGYDASAKGGGSLQIRGQRSVYTEGGHNNPLIVLDGMIFYGELSEINPDDIGQIDILKDASAAAIYGAQAANGVIIVTTKKGQKGKPVINFTSNFGITTRSAYREVYGPDDYIQYREDWYKTPTYGLNPNTEKYEAYQVAKTNVGYFDHPDNLAKLGVSIDQWRGYGGAANMSDLEIYARRLNMTSNVLENYLAGRSFDWYDHTFRTGFNQDYNASVSGAGEHVNYYMSAGYMKNQGAVEGNEYRTVRASLKVNADVTRWLEIGGNVMFQDRSDGDVQPGLGTNYWDSNQIWNSPYASYRNADGELEVNPMGKDASHKGYNFDFNKQYIDLEKGYTVIDAKFSAKLKLPFNITYTFNAAPRYQFFFDRYFESAAHPDWAAVSHGVNREQAKRFDWSLNNTIHWEQSFDKHRLNLTLVQEAEERQYWRDRIESRNILPSDALGFHNTQNGSKTDSSFSTNDSRQTADALLARLFYSYDDRYMLTASVRRDGYSAFGTSNPYATFPSVAGAWTFSNESFFKWAPMSTGKLRVSWGQNGNRALADPYISLANLGSGTGNTMGYLDSSGNALQIKYMSVSRMANPHLRWEATEAWNIGLDFGFFNDRIYGSIEYYVMNTKDMIMNQRLPSFSGFSSIATNLGQVQNRGYEITLSTVNIKNPNFEWRTSAGFSYNKNRIKHLTYDYEDVVDANGNVTGRREADDTSNGWFIGKPISTIWYYQVTGIWQVDEIEEAARYGQKPGDPKVANRYTADDTTNSNGSTKHQYNDKDRIFHGQTSPPIHWSLRNEFTFYKNWTMSFNIYSYWGHKSLSGNYLNQDNGGSMITYALNTFKEPYWTPENPTNKYGRLDSKGPDGITSPSKLYDRSFIRLENISIGYTLPKSLTSKIEIERARVFGSIRNVGVWQKDWEYGDPETGGLATRIFSIGLNVTF